ncbi:MAG: 50S ribosomal protein L1 [Candidatus Woesearchaeota archaeon]
MDKKSIIKNFEELKKEAKERKFPQSVDLVVTLKDINLKKPEEQVEFFIAMPKPLAKKNKICAIVAQDLEEEAKRVCDKVVLQSELAAYLKDKKAVRKLAEEYDFFIAQANIMGQIAGAFGRVFGPRGKMPNPKAGCVVPPKTQLTPIYERLQNTIKLSAKKLPIFNAKVGTVETPAEEIAENIMHIYDQIVHHLPKERHNVRGALMKLTMSKPKKLQI